MHINVYTQSGRQWLWHASSIDTVVFLQREWQQRVLREEGSGKEECWDEKKEKMNLMTTITSTIIDMLNYELHGKGQETWVLFMFS